MTPARKNNSSGPGKATGLFHSMKGTAVEALGSLANSESWQRSGSEEHARGEAEYHAAQAKGSAKGTAHKDSVEGSITQDKKHQASGNILRKSH